jgi:hypothetical protein
MTSTPLPRAAKQTKAKAAKQKPNGTVAAATEETGRQQLVNELREVLLQKTWLDASDESYWRALSVRLNLTQPEFEALITGAAAAADIRRAIESARALLTPADYFRSQPWNRIGDNATTAIDRGDISLRDFVRLVASYSLGETAGDVLDFGVPRFSSVTAARIAEDIQMLPDRCREDVMAAFSTVIDTILDASGLAVRKAASPEAEQ